MSKSKWKFSDRYDYTIETENGGAVCTVLTSEATEKEDLENGRIIVAAPEMLQALKLILEDDRIMNALSKEQAKAVMYSVSKAEGKLK